MVVEIPVGFCRIPANYHCHIWCKEKISNSVTLFAVRPITIIIVPSLRLAFQLLFEIKKMPTDVDEVLVNSEDNDAESSASHFSPQDISLPGPSRRPTQQENLEELRKMFPKKSSDELMQALRFHGNICIAALSLSSTVPEADEDDVSSDDDSLLQPTFSPSESKIDSLSPC